MDRISHFFSDWMQPILGGKNYEKWKKGSFRLQTVVIKNKKLATELEAECVKRGGFLTYSEYLQVDQFGKNGFHAHHKYHGFTPTFRRWAHIAYLYLKKHDIHDVVELGPGSEQLAFAIITYAKRDNFPFLWHGVEVENNFQRAIKNRFTKTHNDNYFGSLSSQPEDLQHIKKALIVSSFCLDSIPPEILVNIKNTVSPPDSMIGIRIEKGILSEFILSPEQLSQKNMQIDRNIFSYKNLSFDFSDLRITPMKRLHTSIKSYDMLYTVLSKIDTATVFIMDEFRISLREHLYSDHYLSPLYLNKKNRYRFNPEAVYERAGNLLFYYPLLLPVFISFLENLGFQTQYDIEPKIIAILSNTPYKQLKSVDRYLCYGVVGTKKRAFPKTSTVHWGKI